MNVAQEDVKQAAIGVAGAPEGLSAIHHAGGKVLYQGSRC